MANYYKEVKDFMKEIEAQRHIECPKSYNYYWEKGRGEVLYATY